MKKHLIAAAVAAAVAAPAMAQNVSVYGVFDTSYSSIKTDTTAAGGAVTSATAKDSGNDGRMSGTRLGFRGTEDLGGGLKAGFVAEFGVNFTETINGVNNGTRLGFVELSGAFGSVRLGRQVSETKAVNDSYTALGNANFTTGAVAGGGIYSAFSTNQGTGAITGGTYLTLGDISNGNGGERVSNMIRYATPNINGFELAVGYANVSNNTSATEAPVVGAANTKYTDVSAKYTTGPFSIMAANSKFKTPDGTGANDFDVKNDHTAIGLTYDAKVAKIFFVNNSRDFTDSTAEKEKRKDNVLGVVVPMGALNLHAAYSDGEAKQGATKWDKSGYQLAAVYNFSKRTNLYAVYGNGETKQNGAATKTEASGYAIGLRHSF